MRIKFRQEQFDKAVEFIMDYNPNGFSRSVVEDSLKRTIRMVAENEEMTWAGTMGHTVLATDVVTDDDGEDVAYIEILVDPSLGGKEYAYVMKDLW